jgi:hypothetical protein
MPVSYGFDQFEERVQVMSNDEVGLVLVGLTVFFAVLGYLLSRAGLEEVSTAARQTQEAAKVAKKTVANAQQSIAQQTGAGAEAVATNSAAVAEATNVISDQFSQVNDALAALTGRQAPARVAWALCALAFVGALVSFELISLTVTPDAGT